MYAIALAALTVLGLCANAVSQSDSKPHQDANQFARQVLNNEVKAEAEDHSHWMLRIESETSRGKQVDEVVETKYGELKRHVVINGRPLDARQRRTEEDRIRKLAANPDALRRSMKGESEDSDRSRKMLKMLPDALIFSYGDSREDSIELHFKSNPNFRPPSHEAQVLQALEGSMWVNTAQNRLAQLSGHLNHEVKFGGGWLGHLNQGGQFEVTQAEVASGYWELTRLHVNMQGKALFFKTISVQQNMLRSDFHRVPDDLTLPQAADLLRKQDIVAAK